MTLTAGLAIYAIMWWLTLFVVLPFGISTHEEEGTVDLGTAPSAPAQPLMLRKLVITTLVSAAIFGVFYWTVTESGMTLDDIPFLPKYGESY